MESTPQFIELDTWLQVRVQNGGFFVSSGRGTHPRRILDSYELIFVHAGELFIREERRQFKVKAGETLILRPGRLHAGTRPYPRDLRFYWVHFTLDDDHAQGEGVQREQVPQRATLSRPEVMEELFRRFLHDQEAGTQSALQAGLHVMLMLAELGQPAPEDASAGSRAVSRLGRVREYIRTHYHEPITTASIAAELCYNPDYLGRLYRRAFGHTITHAIHQERLLQARRLLIHSDESIKEIAYDCGFEDAGSFGRVFRNHEGMSPGSYRRLHAGIHVNTGG